MKNKVNLGIFDQIRSIKNGSKRSKEFDKIKDQWTERGINPLGQIQTRSITGLLLDEANDAAAWKRIGVQHEQRAWPLIDELGIKLISDCQVRVVYPLINGNNTQWVEEGQTIECSTTFDGARLSPRRLVSVVDYSNEVVLSTNAGLETEIESDLIESIFDTVQETMFNDIYVAESATTLSNFDDIVAFELAASQKKISNGVYLVSPIAASKLKKMKNGQMPVMINGMINGFKVIETPSLSGEKIIFGDFTKLLLCQFGIGLDITYDNITKIPIIELVINSYWDWDKLDENAFVYGTTATE